MLNGLELKLTAYADDIAVFSTNPATALTQVTQEAQQFGLFSGYKLNLHKTQTILNFQLDTPAPLLGVTSLAVYLGVCLSSQPEHLVALNYEPLLKKVAAKLRCWHRLPLIILGRCNVVKMNILPKFLYLFRAIPWRVSLTFFKQLDGIIGSFI